MSLNAKMTGMAKLIFELVCAWLNLATKLRLPQCSNSGKPKTFHFKKSVWYQSLEKALVLKQNSLPVPSLK
jgi:hypothetical protein